MSGSSSEALDVRVTHLEREMREVRLDGKAVLASVTRIELELARMPRCSAPNTCLTLGENQTRLTGVLENLDERVRKLENNENKAIGGAKVLVAVGSFFGVVFGLLVSPAIEWIKAVFKAKT